MTIREMMFSRSSMFVTAAAAAALLVLSDNSSQFLLVCGKNLAFSLAVILLALRLVTPKRGLAFGLISLLSALVFALAGADRMPDSWLYTQQDISRILPIIELSWTVILAAIVGLWLLRNKEHQVLVCLIGVAFIAGASARVEFSERQRSAEQFGPEVTARLVDETGRLVGREWMVQNVDYNAVEEKLISGSLEAWSGGLIGEEEPRMMQLVSRTDGVWIEVLAGSGSASWPSMLMVWISMTGSLILWGSMMYQRQPTAEQRRPG